MISAVNVCEIVAQMLDRGSPYDEVVSGLGDLNFMTATFDDERGRRAGELRKRARARNISLADRACLALAIETRLPVYTTDTAWTKLDLGIDIRLIR